MLFEFSFSLEFIRISYFLYKSPLALSPFFWGLYSHLLCSFCYNCHFRAQTQAWLSNISWWYRYPTLSASTFTTLPVCIGKPKTKGALVSEANEVNQVVRGWQERARSSQISLPSFLFPIFSLFFWAERLSLFLPNVRLHLLLDASPLLRVFYALSRLTTLFFCHSHHLSIIITKLVIVISNSHRVFRQRRQAYIERRWAFLLSPSFSRKSTDELFFLYLSLFSLHFLLLSLFYTVEGFSPCILLSFVPSSDLLAKNRQRDLKIKKMSWLTFLASVCTTIITAVWIVKKSHHYHHHHHRPPPHFLIHAYKQQEWRQMRD